MKRLYICIALVSAMAAASVISLIMLKNAGSKLLGQIDRCLEDCTGGDEDELEKELEKLDEYWGDYYVKASFITRSSSLDDISGSVARLRSLLKVSPDDFAAEINSVRYRVELLYESQIPHWRSVF